jgi:hypothetical protein
VRRKRQEPTKQKVLIANRSAMPSRLPSASPSHTPITALPSSAPSVVASPSPSHTSSTALPSSALSSVVASQNPSGLPSVPQVSSHPLIPPRFPLSFPPSESPSSFPTEPHSSSPTVNVCAGIPTGKIGATYDLEYPSPDCCISNISVSIDIYQVVNREGRLDTPSYFSEESEELFFDRTCAGSSAPFKALYNDAYAPHVCSSDLVLAKLYLPFTPFYGTLAEGYWVFKLAKGTLLDNGENEVCIVITCAACGP